MKISRKIDPRYRPLLQKAVRRGHVNQVVTLKIAHWIVGGQGKAVVRPTGCHHGFSDVLAIGTGIKY